MSETKKWIRACGIRAIKTFFQTLAASMSTAVFMSELNWGMVISASILAAIFSICTSIAAGIPEVPFPSISYIFNNINNNETEVNDADNTECAPDTDNSEEGCG